MFKYSLSGNQNVKIELCNAVGQTEKVFADENQTAGAHQYEMDLKNIGAGGLSGKPLKQRSTEIVTYISKRTNGSIPVIASGGIFTGADANEKINAGASLIQVWTGFIYEGPSIVKNICKPF